MLPIEMMYPKKVVEEQEKLTFLGLDEEPILQEALQDLADVALMFLRIL